MLLVLLVLLVVVVVVGRWKKRFSPWYSTLTRIISFGSTIWLLWLLWFLASLVCVFRVVGGGEKEFPAEKQVLTETVVVKREDGWVV